MIEIIKDDRFLNMFKYQTQLGLLYILYPIKYQKKTPYSSIVHKISQ